MPKIQKKRTLRPRARARRVWKWGPYYFKPALYNRFKNKWYRYYGTFPYGYTRQFHELIDRLRRAGFLVENRRTSNGYNVYYRPKMFDVAQHYHMNRCEHCGMRWKDIHEKLSHLPYENGKRTWQEHFQTSMGPLSAQISVVGPIKYCASCGKKLEPNDFRTWARVKVTPKLTIYPGDASRTLFSMLRPDIGIGYRCPRCTFIRERGTLEAIDAIKVLNKAIITKYGVATPMQKPVFESEAQKAYAEKVRAEERVIPVNEAREIPQMPEVIQPIMASEYVRIRPKPKQDKNQRSLGEWIRIRPKQDNQRTLEKWV